MSINFTHKSRGTIPTIYTMKIVIWSICWPLLPWTEGRRLIRLLRTIKINKKNTSTTNTRKQSNLQKASYWPIWTVTQSVWRSILALKMCKKRMLWSMFQTLLPASKRKEASRSRQETSSFKILILNHDHQNLNNKIMWTLTFLRLSLWMPWQNSLMKL